MKWGKSKKKVLFLFNFSVGEVDGKQISPSCTIVVITKVAAKMIGQLLC